MNDTDQGTGLVEERVWTALPDSRGYTYIEPNVRPDGDLLYAISDIPGVAETRTFTISEAVGVEISIHDGASWEDVREQLREVLRSHQGLRYLRIIRRIFSPDPFADDDELEEGD